MLLSRAASGARSAQALWQLAHHLHPNEPLVQERRARRRFRQTQARATGPHPGRSRFDELDLCEGSSRRHGCVKKDCPQAIGKPRGGWTTKIHLVAANARSAITFALSLDQAPLSGFTGKRQLQTSTSNIDGTWAVRKSWLWGPVGGSRSGTI